MQRVNLLGSVFLLLLVFYNKIEKDFFFLFSDELILFSISFQLIDVIKELIAGFQNRFNLSDL